MSVANIQVNNITAGPAEYLEVDGIGYETRQSSFFLFLLSFLALTVHKTEVVYSVLRN